MSIAAGMLVEMVGQLQTEQSERFMEQMKARIWEGYGCAGHPGRDEVAKSVTEAVQKIEALCRRQLKA